MQKHLAIPADHPSLPGHFPGNPVVPGVVILDEIVALACEAFPDCRLESVSSVKFMAPLLPQQIALLEITSQDTASLSFSFRVTRTDADEPTLLAKGRLQLARAVP